MLIRDRLHPSILFTLIYTMPWPLPLRKIPCRLNAFVLANKNNVCHHRKYSKPYGKCLYVRRVIDSNLLRNELSYYKSSTLLHNAQAHKFRYLHTADDCQTFKVNGEEETDNHKNIATDVDFQNILKDFVKDFEVTEESSKVLEEIKKKQEHLNESDLNNFETHDPDKKVNTYSGFKEFYDTDATIIPSYEEEQSSAYDSDEKFFHIDQESKNKYFKYTDKRGETGVFDIAELVDILKGENLREISVIQIPKSYHYADYMVLGTAKSPRHLVAFTEFLNKHYKTKKNKSDPFVIIEGGKASSWRAMDMGNIVLHIFLKETRIIYDIESLWTLDREYDSGGGISQADPFAEMMEQHLNYMDSLQPSQTP